MGSRMGSGLQSELRGPAASVSSRYWLEMQFLHPTQTYKIRNSGGEPNSLHYHKPYDMGLLLIMPRA